MMHTVPLFVEKVFTACLILLAKDIDNLKTFRKSLGYAWDACLKETKRGFQLKEKMANLNPEDLQEW